MATTMPTTSTPRRPALSASRRHDFEPNVPGGLCDLLSA
jgi:hypothetical protein